MDSTNKSMTVRAHTHNLSNPSVTPRPALRSNHKSKLAAIAATVPHLVQLTLGLGHLVEFTRRPLLVALSLVGMPLLSQFLELLFQEFAASGQTDFFHVDRKLEDCDVIEVFVPFLLALLRAP